MEKIKKCLSVLLTATMIFCIIPFVGNVKTEAKTIAEDNVKEFNGHYYKVFAESKTWSAAKTFCESKGGHLATITSSAEQNFITNMIKQNSPKRHYWIGGTDEGHEGKWEWVTGETWNYTNWDQGEPNNDGYWGDENCLVFCRDFTWNDIGEKGGEAGDTYDINNLGIICEWDSFDSYAKKAGPLLPQGYNFNKDSYNFGNFRTTIEKNYFQTIYGDANGQLLWEKKKDVSLGGVCFGMVYTTASYINGFPTSTNIRDLSVNSTIQIGSNNISVLDYIKYAYIYQFSKIYNDTTVWDADGRTIYNIVKEYLKSDNIGVAIGMGNVETKKGHITLAVGIDGDSILIDDPNNPTGYECITIRSDGSWIYSGDKDMNDKTNILYYALDYYAPYRLLAKGKTVEASDTISISKLDIVDGDKKLLAVKAGSYKLSNQDLKLIPTISGEESPDTADLYWLEDDSITISDIVGTDNEFSMSGNDEIITVKAKSASNVTFNADEYTLSTTFDTAENSECEISLMTFDEDGNSVSLSVVGTTNSDTVEALQTETGFAVSGFESGTVTLTKEDELISENSFICSDGSVDIALDETGENSDIEIEYEQIHTFETETVPATCTDAGSITRTCTGCGEIIVETIPAKGHSDTDNDGVCDICKTVLEEKTEEPTPCSHICHKSGFFGFIWKIVNFFNKLFGKNQYCTCNEKHW